MDSRLYNGGKKPSGWKIPAGKVCLLQLQKQRHDALSIDLNRSNFPVANFGGPTCIVRTRALRNRFSSMELQPTRQARSSTYYEIIIYGLLQMEKNLSTMVSLILQRKRNESIYQASINTTIAKCTKPNLTILPKTPFPNPS